ncbi:helix-turn-helix transcriptional regulator [Streptomyces violarus]|uniref:ATP/maltotriose-dependent transcriptional regulator MalT n=1 Tax=Streptomyces violarus TaxID=67380 RepID=A0A7W4ZT16_9ACTN|nr:MULTISPECIES: LuxR family transcriptional regulator [Streptomyces]MBB3078088.1 ATP/maltotriose-dependent transcriptional regulator MalT [Streptomyces violarus]WRT99755.1 LuxR C-terminal-related transcriptional regulator [Streptomyces sp. CGMCC 4.1772]GHD19628.1 helix-turn-helix transcriptional regulator [Streptomyces violarus]
MGERIPVVGRNTELALIRQALEATKAGTGRFLLFEGSAGIGKSRLLAEAIQQAGKLGMTVATGQATELDRVAPLSLLLTTLRTSTPPVVDADGLVELRAHGGMAADRLWLLDRIGCLIEEHARRRPLLIALDNAHFMDQLTELALVTLIPRLRGLPVMWLLARNARSERPGCLELMERPDEEFARCVRLSTLDSTAVQEYCTHAFGAPAGPGLTALAMRSGGNPFLLKHLLTTLHTQGRVSTAGGTAVVHPGENLPSDFVSAVSAQLRHLSLATRRLLEAGAVLNRPFSLNEVSDLLGRRPIALMSQVEEAVETDLLVDQGAAFAFRHDLVRDAVYERLSGPLRRALHQETASVLQRRGGSRAEVVLHLVRGGGDDAQTVAALCEAGKELARSAPGAAADMLFQALDLVPADAPERADLVARTVRLLASAGRIAEARELGESMLHETGFEVYVGLAEALKHAGQDSLVVDYTERALDLPGVPDPVRGQLLAVQAHALLNCDEPERADARAAQAIELGEPSTAAFAAAAHSAAARALGRVEEAVAHAVDAVRLADESGPEARHWHPRYWLGRALTAADRLDEADAAFDRGEQETQELGSAWSLPLWYFGRAEARMTAGRLDDAEAAALAGKEASERLGALAVVPSLLIVLAQVAIHRDELTQACDLVREARRLGQSGYRFPPQSLAWVQAQLAYAHGEPKGAVTALASVYDALEERPILLTEIAWAAPAMARFAVDAGEPQRAKHTARVARRLADASPETVSLTAAAHHAEGLVRGDLDALRAAVDAYRSGPRQLARALALMDVAHAEAAAGRRSRAITVLEEALELFTQCGAKRSMARARRDLRNLGVRPKKWKPLARAKTGWDSLTLAELRVVRLVAQGLTNRIVAQRLFLSPHTVDTHLRHAFAKLGVSSRVELTRHALLADQNSEARRSPDHVKA